MRSALLRTGALLLALLSTPAMFGAPRNLLVVDGDGRPVADAVVWSTSRSAASSSAKGRTAIMDQQDRQFVPYVLAVQTGTIVRFPNSDDIRHHVYSFSPAKKFELPLYKGTTAAPVSFSVPGIVTLGCNIHDAMVGYIVVLDSDRFAKTDAGGKATLDLADGTSVSVWHPRMAEDNSALDGARVKVTAAREIRLRIALSALEEENQPSPLEKRFKRFGRSAGD